jgi:hypothetical protein
VYGGTNSKQSAYNTCVNLQRSMDAERRALQGR